MLQKMPSKTHNSLHDKLNYFNVKPHNYKLAGLAKKSIISSNHQLLTMKLTAKDIRDI